MAKFETFEVAVQFITALKPAIVAIASHDRNLADQLKRSASSVPLNISEGARRVGRDRNHCFRIAAGSAAEARAALAVAQAWGYISSDSYAEVSALLDRLLAMLWRLTHPRP